MSKKYLTLEEAARMLSLAPDELVRLRERGEIRGFADRGTWKFKEGDVEQLARRRQADSNPEVQLHEDSAAKDSHLLADDEARPDSLSDSDSDVRLVGGSEIDLSGLDSDSDVKLVGLGEAVGKLGEGTDPEIPMLKKTDSDSDVKLVRPDSDSDVKLPGDDSDSDVQLVGGTEPDISMTDKTQAAADAAKIAKLHDSDSDVKLTMDSKKSKVGDVTIIQDEQAVPIEPKKGKKRGDSALDDESGISLASDSSVLVGSESGISLEGPSDSGIALNAEAGDEEGITLELDQDSGISIDTGESGISLESESGSGISLESTGDSGISIDEVGRRTIPMMDAKSDEVVPETQFEIPQLDEKSGYSKKPKPASREGQDTGVLDMELDDVEDAVFDLDEEAAPSTEFEAADELDLEAGAFDEEEQLDVFEGDEAFGEMEGEPAYAAAGAARMPAAEADWDTATFVGLVLASLALVLCGGVMIDLLRNSATAAQPNPVSGVLLDALGSLYK